MAVRLTEAGLTVIIRALCSTGGVAEWSKALPC